YGAAFDSDPEPAMRLAKRLRDSLPNPFRARDVQRRCWSGLDSADAVERALLVLEERNWVKAMDTPPGPEGGRPTPEYWVHPAVLNEDSSEGIDRVSSVSSVPGT